MTTKPRVHALTSTWTRPDGEPSTTRITEAEINATTEHNRRALDAWLQARRARLNPEK